MGSAIRAVSSSFWLCAFCPEWRGRSSDGFHFSERTSISQGSLVNTTRTSRQWKVDEQIREVE
jgi:hypothetical protein